MLGDHDEAITWLERAYEAGYRRPVLAGMDPFFASLRDDPRFQAIIDSMAARVAEQLAQAEADGSLAIIDAISAGVSPQTFLERR